MAGRDGFSPVKGKCIYWREVDNEEDRWDTRVPRAEKRVECSCFVEGMGWSVTQSTVPEDCPDKLHCRYYVKAS